MIFLNVKIGETTLTGISFSIVNQVDNVEILMSNLNSLTSQRTHTILENSVDTQVVTSTSTENFGTGLTLSVYLTADNDVEVDTQAGTFVGIKSIYVELLP